MGASEELHSRLTLPLNPTNGMSDRVTSTGVPGVMLAAVVGPVIWTLGLMT